MEVRAAAARRDPATLIVLTCFTTTGCASARTRRFLFSLSPARCALLHWQLFVRPLGCSLVDLVAAWVEPPAEASWVWAIARPDLGVPNTRSAVVGVRRPAPRNEHVHAPPLIHAVGWDPWCARSCLAPALDCSKRCSFGSRDLPLLPHSRARAASPQRGANRVGRRERLADLCHGAVVVVDKRHERWRMIV